MILNLEPVFKNDKSLLPFDFEFDLSQGDLHSCLPLSSVSVKGEVQNKSNIVSLEAKVSFSFSTPCARCLKQVKRKISLPVKHTLAVELQEEDNDDFILVPNLSLDLGELIREDILLHFPSRFICADDCKGLCTFCGIDLNIETCKCKKPIDPRLAALADLLED